MQPALPRGVPRPRLHRPPSRAQRPRRSSAAPLRNSSRAPARRSETARRPTCALTRRQGGGRVQKLTAAGVLGVLGHLDLLDLFPQRSTIAHTVLTGDVNLPRTHMSTMRLRLRPLPRVLPPHAPPSPRHRARRGRHRPPTEQHWPRKRRASASGVACAPHTPHARRPREALARATRDPLHAARVKDSPRAGPPRKTAACVARVLPRQICCPPLFAVHGARGAAPWGDARACAALRSAARGARSRDAGARWRISAALVPRPVASATYDESRHALTLPPRRRPRRRRTFLVCLPMVPSEERHEQSG